ncbi:hypothetical protein PAMP_016423 [Pampus punctatissimus]
MSEQLFTFSASPDWNVPCAQVTTGQDDERLHSPGCGAAWAGGRSRGGGRVCRGAERQEHAAAWLRSVTNRGSRDGGGPAVSVPGGSRVCPADLQEAE